MIEFTIALLVAVVLAAAIMGGLALYGSLSSHEKRSPATNTVAGDNPSPSPTSTTRILNVSGAWGYVKPLIKWLTIITIVTLVAVVVFAFVKWEAPNTTDVTATTSSAFPYFNISDLFIAELLLIGVVVLALASILLLFRRSGSVTSVFGRDLIFLVIVGVMIYTLYHYQLLKTPVFWFVVAMLLLVLWLVSKNLRFRLVMFFAFLILAAIFFQQGIEHGITWLDRGINHREWLTEQPLTAQSSVIEQPPRFTDGMILDLRPGQSKLIVLAGKIKVINYDRYHCLNFGPKGTTERTYNEGNTEALVRPLRSVEQTVRITKLRPGESIDGEICPARSD